MIAAGGTAGHVNPALALAGVLAGDDVTFIGTVRGAEARLVPAAGFPLRTIEIRGFDRAKPWTLLPTAAVAARAIGTAAGMLPELQPDVVVGMGGYVSLPVVLAASARGVPVVIHEQNIVFGLANRVCKRFARAVAVSFEETLPEAGARGMYVGNPVAPQLTSFDRDEERRRGMARFDLDPQRKTLLVFGGSQGAARINRAAVGLASLWRDRSDRQVVHITGPAHLESTRSEVARVPGALIYRVTEFVDRMLEAYAVTDLALCRGGASTVAELSVVGVPALVVPYPYHRDRQQERHALVLEKAGAARVLPDPDTTAERVAGEADALLANGEVLATMRANALKFGRPDAAARLAELVRRCAA